MLQVFNKNRMKVQLSQTKNSCKTFHLFRTDASQKVDQMMFFSGHMGILTASTKATPQKSRLTKGTMVVNNTFLRSHPHTPGGYPGPFTNSSVSQFLSLWVFGGVWGYLWVSSQGMWAKSLNLLFSWLVNQPPPNVPPPEIRPY